MSDSYSWLTDKAIDRAQALGFEMHAFLVRRRAARQIDPEAEVEIGSELKNMLASLQGRDEDD